MATLMRTFISVLLLTAWSFAGMAQGAIPGAVSADTVAATRKDSTSIPDEIRKRVLKLVFTFNNNRSLFHRPSYTMNGIKIGLELDRTWRFGFEINNLRDTLRQTIVPDQFGSIQRQLDFSSLSLYGEYVLYRDYRWEVAIPATVGLGTGRYLYVNAFNTPIRETEVSDITMYQVGVTGHYRLVSFLGFGAGLGYRQLVTPDAFIRSSISAPIVHVKVKLFFGYLVRGIFNPQSVRDERTAYQEEKAARKAARLQK